jgi:hypothetical protein
MTPTWFSRDDAIEMWLILVNAILEMLCSLDFANTSWVVDLGDITNGGGSTSIQFMTVLGFHKSGKLGSWCFMLVNRQQRH